MVPTEVQRPAEVVLLKVVAVEAHSAVGRKD